MISNVTLERLTEQKRALLGGLNRRLAHCQVCNQAWVKGRIRSLWFDGEEIGFICKGCCPAALQTRLWDWLEEP